MDSRAAPTRQVRAKCLSSPERTGAAVAAAGEALSSALFLGSGSRVDNSAAPTRQVRAAGLTSGEREGTIAGACACAGGE